MSLRARGQAAETMGRKVIWLTKTLQIFLILALILVLKIGQLPTLLVQFIFKLIKNKTTKAKPVKHLSFFHRHRGRPRIKPWRVFYLLKLKRLFNKFFPRSIRFRALATAGLLILLGYTVLISKLITNLPSPNQLTETAGPLTTQIFDRNGTLLYQVYDGRNRKLIKLNELPPYLIQATVAIEDKHFFSHQGVDLSGVIRALRTNYSQGTLQGGSTITQQLIKNTLLTPDKTFKRKAKEIILAFWAERIYKKEEILQMYFNEAPYGGTAWGVEAASEMYFGKSADKLTLAESAFLAGLPAAPTEYSPYGPYPEKGKERQREVLRRMVEDGYISGIQAEEAGNEELTLLPPFQDIKAPHFVMYIRSLLSQRYGERVVSQGGLKVVTTLDLPMQKIAEKAVEEEVDKLADWEVGNGAAMVTDSKTGQILAMVGSKNYFDDNQGNFNVTLALRQPGSSIKVVTYVTAFLQGYTPGTVLLDTPTTFPNPWGQSYSPVNYDGKFHGPVTIRTALGSSYNVPAVKMLAIVGVPAMIQTAKEMGITTFTSPKDYGLSLTLGGGAVKMIDMMAVYGVLASGGVKYQPQPILKITDSFGNILEDNSTPEGQRTISEEVAYFINSVLSDNNARTPAFGPDSLLKIPGHTVAVKTGTSDDKRDNWTFGYTPEYVVGVWVGNNNNSPMNPQLTSGITGAAPIWNRIMAELIKERPDLAFARPAKIEEVAIDGQKDLGVSGQKAKSVIGLTKTKQKDGASGGEKESITYTDPFTNYTPDQTKITQ